jgi:hypothetical protein
MWFGDVRNQPIILICLSKIDEHENVWEFQAYLLPHHIVHKNDYKCERMLIETRLLLMWFALKCSQLLSFNYCNMLTNVSVQYKMKTIYI